MIPTGGGTASGVGAGSAGGFPDQPTGSPGEISAIARSLGQSAGELEETERGLSSATEALVADWAGYAANAYRSSSGALAAAARGANASLRECAGAVAGYAGALEAAQSELTRLRGQYEEAKGRQAAAAATATNLTGHLTPTTKSSAIHQLQADISTANHQASSAGEEAAAYVQRAIQVLDRFHQEENRYMQMLAGGGSVAGGRSLPAGSPFAAPFAGVGATGPGFGVPYTAFGGIVPGGLAAYNGVIPVGNPANSDIPGYGIYIDGRTGNLQPTGDLTTAITLLVGGPVSGALGDVLAGGAETAAEKIGVDLAAGGAGDTAEGGGALATEPQGGLNLYRYKDPTSTTGEGWAPGDFFLSPKWRGTPKLTWQGNASLLRNEMGQGRPIYESFVDSNGELLPSGGPGQPGQFLRAERNLLSSHGWTYNPGMRAWLPPGP